MAKRTAKPNVETPKAAKQAKVETPKPPATKPATAPVAKPKTRPLDPAHYLQSWHREARIWLGTKEIPGPEHNKYILEMHAATTLHAKSDEIPWCSSFICWILESTGIRSTRSAAAKSYQFFGRECTPITGAICVLKRPGGHHVGIVEYVDADGNPTLLGGNQSDSVSVKTYKKDDVLCYRWPSQEQYADKPIV